MSFAVPITISLSCFFVIIVVSIVLFIYNSNMKNENNRVMADIVNQLNDSNFYAYKFDQKQEDNIQNVDHNVIVIDKKQTENEKAMNEVNKVVLTQEKLTKGIPNAKIDNLNVKNAIEFPNNGAALVWGSSKISDNGDLSIQTKDRIIITSPESVRVNTNIFNVSNNPVLLSDYEIFTNASDDISKGGQWVIDGNSKEPLFRGLVYSMPENDQDAESVWIDYQVPTGMKQAYVVHQPLSNCRYFDVYGKKGDSYLFIKRVDAYNPNNNIVQVTTAIGISGVNRFESIRIKGRKGRINLIGIGWTKEEGRDMETGYTHWDNVYNKPNLYENDKWMPSNDGQNRVKYAKDSKTSYSSLSGYEWRSSQDTNLLNLSNEGNATILGNVKADTINVNKNVSIRGQLDTTSLITSGNVTINNETKTNKLVTSGGSSIKGQLDTGNINTLGNITVSGQLDSFSLNSSGDGAIKGNLTANTITTSGNTIINGQVDTNILNTLGNASIRGNTNTNTINADGVVNFKNVVTVEKNINTRGNLTVEGQLCFSDVCVNKDQLRNLISQNQQFK